MTHEFKVALATQFGIEEAILIHNFYYWILENKANDRNYFEGRYWTYNALKAYKELFPYLNEGKVKRVISSLIDKGILTKGNHNANQYDRTNWYAFTDEGLAIVQKHYIHWTKMTNGLVENVPPIPNNKPYNKTNILFTPSSEAEDGDLFGEDATSTLTMLSSEKNIPYAQGDTKPTKAMQEDCFEDLWLMYERKGSKANAKKEFAKLSEEEIATMRQHIPAYLESRPERQYRQDFERYIKHKTFNSVVYSKQNVILFDPESTNSSATIEAPQVFSEQSETITINGVTYR